MPDFVTAGHPETIANILQRVIGDNACGIDADVDSLSVGGATPPLLIKGVSKGDRVPDDMLAMYQQFYAQSVSIPAKTGMSYSTSLAAGGSFPYDGGVVLGPTSPTTVNSVNPVDTALPLVTEGNGPPSYTTPQSAEFYIDLSTGELYKWT